MKPSHMLVALVIFAATPAGAAFGAEPVISGAITTPDRDMSGVFVTATDTSRGVRYTAVTATDGAYALRVVPGSYTVTAHQAGFEPASAGVDVSTNVTVNLSLEAAADVRNRLPSSFIMGALPESVETREFVIDCLGCHQLNQALIYNDDGELLDEAAWHSSTEKMLQFAGHKSPFPIIPPDRLAAPTAEWVARYLTETRVDEAVESTPPVRAAVGTVRITEYDLPNQKDFPHDLMLAPSGSVVITGMFSSDMFVLDPATGAFTKETMPLPFGNARALDISDAGDWYVLCGMPLKIAHFAAGPRAWKLFDIGMYGHSVKLDAEGRVWFNGHFSNDPIKMGYVDTGSGEVTVLEVPPNEMPASEGGPVPYGLRVGPDGTVWSTELAGNRLVRYSPETGEFKTYYLPSPHSGPRRLDVAPDGTVWVPEFAGGKLARFDPESETFSEYEFPTPNSLPYCARVNPVTGHVWVSQAGNDAIARFDPETGEAVEFRLPSQVAFIRHIDVDPKTGDVWGAYAHSPGVHPGVVRLETE